METRVAGPFNIPAASEPSSRGGLLERACARAHYSAALARTEIGSERTLSFGGVIGGNPIDVRSR
jgi:hypothetical protein